jgi:aryl-alcohol dehydrogenase-like predicted oxidoreductase
MAELERRRLGRTEMRPLALSLGCAFCGADKYSDSEAVEGIRRAIELGIDFVDTSPLYGESERRVGLALEGGLRDKVYLETKTGTHPDRRGDYSAEATRWSVENSLRLLKTDYLDSVLIHDPQDIEDPLGPGRALDELIKMRDKGLLKHIGVGLRRHDFHKRAIETGEIEIVLTFLDYTLLDQSVAETTFPLAREHDVGLILASVLGMGSLTGLEPDPEVEKRRNPDGEPVAHRMWSWCRDRDVNIRALAIQFCLAAPIQGIVMPGPSGRKHVEEAYEAATVDIPDEVWRDFRAEFGVGVDIGSAK